MNPSETAALGERLEAVRGRLAGAARIAGRKPEDVRLIAVSKLHPVEAILAAYGFGQRVFGENYVQEALAKQEALPDLDVEWHCIGHVQTNKAKDVTGRFALIHTVDNLKFAETLARRLPEDIPVQRVLLQGRAPAAVSGRLLVGQCACGPRQRHTENGGKVVAVNQNKNTPSGKSLTVEYTRTDGSKVQCIYMHLKEISVKVGDTVQAGGRLGTSGNTGTRTTGEHLHFGVKNIYADGTKRDIDPAAYLAEIAQKGHIKLQMLHNGNDLLAKYKAAEDTVPEKNLSPDGWMKKLLSSEDSGVAGIH